MSQALYDWGMSQAPGPCSTEALPELYTAGLDPEQIWMQLDEGGQALRRRVRGLIRKLPDQLQLMSPDMEEALQGENHPPGLILFLCATQDIA